MELFDKFARCNPANNIQSTVMDKEFTNSIIFSTIYNVDKVKGLVKPNLTVPSKKKKENIINETDKKVLNMMLNAEVFNDREAIKLQHKQDKL